MLDQPEKIPSTSVPERVFDPGDPAASDDTSENARNGARKRRDVNEPVAVVGLGASAGGVSVLQQFFSEMPTDSGLAFVVVMHLSPDYESNLPSVIRQKTSMPVIQIRDPEKVKPNHIYVIPPSKQLTFEDGALHLIEPQQALGRRVTIDLFFRTLAQAYGQRSICVILSGTDSDGVIGLKHVRAQGGVTIAQEPTEAEHDSMPATAISTGMVDWVLRVAEMPAKLMEFVRNESRMKLPPEIPDAEGPDQKVRDAPGGETISDETRDPEDENAIGEVLAHLRGQTGHDFSHYKRASVLRRIARRLQVNSMESLPEYLQFLRKHPLEARALLHDLLIGVTHFFRDQESFAALAANIPQLFAGKRKEDQIRVWVAGCATGEEAYSIAMLLCEHADRLDFPPAIQVFASDIDDQSIVDARAGLYPATIEADVTTERLRRFFVRDHGRYRVRKELREKILFASHNLLKDAPFSRLDLVSCRNLLIYLNGKAQEQAFDIFHFALRSGGLLFIGSSESEANVQSLFSPVDAKHRLYVRRSVPRPSWKIPVLPLSSPEIVSHPPPRTLPPLTHHGAGQTALETTDQFQKAHERRAALFGELHLRLLEQYGPPSVVVNEAHEIVHLSMNAGRYLQFAAGEPSANLLELIHPALRVELRTALFRAAQSKERVETGAQTVEIDGTREVVSVQVRPIEAADPVQGFYLVLFEKNPAAKAVPATSASSDDVARELDEEIQYLKGQLSTTVEQYEASNEELKASNEELQAMNEELRSATEELETSKEELQSVNEELVTVNHELKNSVEELSRTNADLNNLMASTDIGTIFLNRELLVQRFTPSAQKVFNLIPADLGRPLSDITHKLAYEGLIQDAKEVLQNLATIEREVRMADETWFLTRIAPYRTAEDRIAGVVATFIDITRRKQAEIESLELARQLKAQLDKFNTVMTAVPDFIYHFDLEGRFTYMNQALLDLWQKTSDDAVGKNFHELDYPPELAERLQSQIQEVIKTRRVVKDEAPYTSAFGARFYEYIFFPLLADDGSVEAVAGTTRDITDRKTAEEALRQSEQRFRQFAENSADVFWIVDAETRELEYLNPVYEKMWGESRDVLMADFRHGIEIVHPEDQALAGTVLPRVLKGETVTVEYRIVRPNDGQVRWIRDTGFPIPGRNGRIARVAGVAQDVTEDKRYSEKLREAEERLRLLVDGARDYAMFLMDPGSVITYWSVGAERVFGWSQAEAIGQSGSMIFTREDQARGAVEREIDTALVNGRSPDRRFHVRKDGSRFWTDGVLMRLDDEQGELRGFAKIARDASEQREVEDQLRHARDEFEQRVVERTAELMASNTELQNEMSTRQQLERDLLEISERERRRIGQDLHDVVCQELTATALFLKSSGNKASDAEAARSLNEAAHIVNRNVGLARELARGFQPVQLASGGLTTALRSLCTQANEHAEISCHLKLPRLIRIRDETVALNLFRIAQEGVTNAIKHAHATEITVCVERERDLVRLVVEDNGKGLKKTKKRGKGLGLHIMRYRASVLGGHLTIETRPKNGTRLVATVPIQKKNKKQN
jgi:two-component system CheB/CheR fusion protein